MGSEVTERSTLSARRWALRSGAMAMLAGIVACSIVIHADREQCARKEDCLGHGLSANAMCVESVCMIPDASAPIDTGGPEPDVDSGPVDPRWACIGNVAKGPSREPNVPVHYLARFELFADAGPLVGLPVSACNNTDSLCAAPIDGTPVLTDSAGFADFNLFSGFLGFFQMGAYDGGPADLMDHIHYVLPQPDADAGPPVEQSVVMFTSSQLTAFAAGFAKEVKPELGHIFFTAIDCQGNPAADLTLKSDTVTASTFLTYSDADGTATLTQGKTSARGTGAVVNLPLGAISMTLSRETGQQLGRRNVLVQKGKVTTILLGPN
ncbi:MAG TPA: hypothetical protein VM925_06845 [Labilithrix sp.]|jgi:hypothetical protein|nr:hypothetical protein [Labilithrix sp.]